MQICFSFICYRKNVIFLGYTKTSDHPTFLLKMSIPNNLHPPKSNLHSPSPTHNVFLLMLIHPNYTPTPPKYTYAHPHPPMKNFHPPPTTQLLQLQPPSTPTHHHLYIKNVRLPSLTQHIHRPTPNHPYSPMKNVHLSLPTQNIPLPTPSHTHLSINNACPPPPAQNIPRLTPNHPHSPMKNVLSFEPYNS